MDYVVCYAFRFLIFQLIWFVHLIGLLALTTIMCGAALCRRFAKCAGLASVGCNLNIVV